LLSDIWRTLRYNWEEILFAIGKWSAIIIVVALAVLTLLAIFFGFFALFFVGGGWLVFKAYNGIAQSQEWGEITWLTGTIIFFLGWVGLTILAKR